MTSINPSLDLVCGDPQNEPATFSRFVFPFAYTLQTVTEDASVRKDDFRYEVENLEKGAAEQESLQERRDYFTFETQQVLFDRARWLRMNAEAWKDCNWGQPVLYPCRDKTIEVCMKPPRLVLFECEWPGKNAGQERKDTLLQTGFLLVELFFQKPINGCRPDLTDLLEINEIFRCYRRPYKGHWQKFRNLLSNMEQKVTESRAEEEQKGNSRSTIGSYQEEEYQDAYLDRWTQLLDFPVEEPGKSGQLFRLHWKKDQKKECSPIELGIDDSWPYADHRSYVWSAAILDKGGGSLQRAFCTSNWHAHAYGHWIKLLNVDSPDESLASSKTHNAVRDFERQWAEERTYHRWEQWGTWYGFSYHSGVMLGPPSREDEEGPNKKAGVPLWQHFRLMYFDMALLLLYIRVTLFRVSRELSAITDEQKNSERCRQFTRLRETFILFTIRYQFPLLSNQQQAIEMYDLARKHFDIDELYAEVRREIETAHEFVTINEQKNSTVQAEKLATAANDLTKKGIPLAVAAVVAGIFGMNAGEYDIPAWVGRVFLLPTYDQAWGWFKITDEFWAFIFIAGIVVLAWAFAKKYLNKKDSDGKGGKDG